MSDEAGVINIEDHRPHIHGHAMCLGCKREWMAVAPESTTKIECPNCHSMDGRFLGASRNCSRCNYEKLVLRERAAMEQLDCRRWQECGRELSQEVDRLRARAFYLAAENDKDKQRIAELERERKALMEVVNEQAEDDGLWFVAESITEDMLQRALRRLHAAAEGEAK